MDFLMQDTIAAISTPPGEGGIGIVRISGNEAAGIAKKMFRTPSGKIPVIKPRKVHYGNIVDPDASGIVDEVILTYMKAPASYTTQDIIEINCHGGPVILKKVLEIALSCGARIAEPGEFTKRAFLGGRLDLAQAEAVMDLIRAKTDQARQVAIGQLRGNLSCLINSLRENLIDFMLQLEVRIDFCEDDIPSLNGDYKEERISAILYDVNNIIAGFEKGKIYREGLKACIIGPPNVGKSTLLNALLDEERAIVTPIPGTTRDRIEETVNLAGVPLVLIDTAGIRESDDAVESIGIRRSIEAAKSADMAFLVLDASCEYEERAGIEEIMKHIDPGKTLVILNKIDLGMKIPADLFSGKIPDERIVEVSLIKNSNVDLIEKAAKNMIFSGATGSASEIIISDARHRDALIRTAKHLENARGSIIGWMQDDFITIDLKAAVESLGEITGKLFYEEMIDKIFNGFCIGK